MRMLTHSVIAVLLAAGCTQPAPQRWEALESGYVGAFLGAWGSSATDVWLVGADARDAGDGQGPLALHFDGTTWTRYDSGLRGIDLWWVYGFPHGPVFFGGSNGTVVRYDPTVSPPFQKLQTPGTSYVFGIWGASPSDLWIVGGQADATGFVWRYDGSTITPLTLPSDVATHGVWKVSGASATDVWISCSLGIVLHWDGQTLAEETVGSVDERLFSIGATSKLVVAVGGNITTGHIYERIAGAWSQISITPGDPVWRGVAVTDTTSYALGESATIATRRNGTWTSEVVDGATDSFHAGWIDPSSALWAVGGNLGGIPPSNGQVFYKGSDTIPALGL